MSVYNTTILFSYTFKILYYQGDIFRHSLGHLQTLKETRYKIYGFFYKNALWDPK
jgi:hypothetical protein